MTLAVRTPDDLRALPAIPDGPRAVIIWRQPFAAERQEIFARPALTPGDAPTVDAGDVVKALCRSLDVGPAALAFEADPQARHLKGEAARCYVLNAAGERIAHVSGVSCAWLQVDAARLDRTGWRPGRNREFVAFDAAAASHT